MSMIAADLDADQSLFMADISLINGAYDRRYSDVAGTMTTNKMLKQASYMEFEVVPELTGDE